MKFGIPLIEKGIASIIIENPFYGLRKPKEQSSCSLSFVLISSFLYHLHYYYYYLLLLILLLLFIIIIIIIIIIILSLIKLL